MASPATAAASGRLEAAVAPLSAAADFLSVFEAPERHLELALTLHTNKSVRRRVFGHLEDAITAVCQSDAPAGSASLLDAALAQWRLDSGALGELCRTAWEMHAYFAFLDVKGDKALLEVVARELSDLIGCGGIRRLGSCLVHTGPWVAEALRSFADRGLGPLLAKRHDAALRAWRAQLARRVAQLPEPRRQRVSEAEHGHHFWEAYFSNLYHISWPDFAEAFEEFYLHGRCPVDVLAQLRRRLDPAREHRVRKSAWQRVPQAAPAEGGEAIIDLVLGEVLEDIMPRIFRAESVEYAEWPQRPAPGAAQMQDSSCASSSTCKRPFASSGVSGRGASQETASQPAPPAATAAATATASLPKQVQLFATRPPGAGSDPSATPYPRPHQRLVGVQLEDGDAARATPLDPRSHQLGPARGGPRMEWDQYVAMLASQIRQWYAPSGVDAPLGTPGLEPLHVAALRVVSSSSAYTQRALILRVVSGDLAANRPLLGPPRPGCRDTEEETPLPALVITAHDTRFSGVTKFGRGSSRRTLLPDMQMDEPIASRSHFNITYDQQADRFCLMDAGSKWGTFVKISTGVPLNCGDWIRVGNAEFVIRYCGGGCRCRNNHSHYKLHSLRIQNEQQQRGLTMRGLASSPCWSPASAGAAAAAADEGESSPLRVEFAEPSCDDHDVGSGMRQRDQVPLIQDGIHLFLSGMKQAIWLPQSARLCQASALRKAGVLEEGRTEEVVAKPPQPVLSTAAAPKPKPATLVPVPPLELDFISGPRTGERITLCERRCTMGRGEQSTIQVSDPMLANVSRIHCVFEYSGNRWHIRDNGSTNGTWRRLSCVLEPSRLVPLTEGMSILAGVHEFRVEEGTMGQWCLPSAATAVLEEMAEREQKRDRAPAHRAAELAP